MTKFENLIFQRRGKRITLKEIANHIGCTEALLSMYENKKCEISIEKKKKYEEYIINN